MDIKTIIINMFDNLSESSFYLQFPINNDVEYHLMWYQPFCSSCVCVKCLVSSFAHLILDLSYYLGVVRGPYTFWMQVLHQIYISQFFSQIMTKGTFRLVASKILFSLNLEKFCILLCKSFSAPIIHMFDCLILSHKSLWIYQFPLSFLFLCFSSPCPQICGYFLYQN